MENLAGKYIIIKDGYNGKMMYLENTGIRCGIYVIVWTDNMRHARDFGDYTEAKIKCGNLHNRHNARVRYVDNNYSLKIPKYEKERSIL